MPVANSLQKAAILISVKQIQVQCSEVSRLTRTLEVIYFIKHSLQLSLKQRNNLLHVIPNTEIIIQLTTVSWVINLLI